MDNQLGDGDDRAAGQPVRRICQPAEMIKHAAKRIGVTQIP